MSVVCTGDFFFFFLFLHEAKKKQNYQCTCGLDVSPRMLLMITVTTGPTTLTLTGLAASQDAQKHTVFGFAYCLSHWARLPPLEHWYKDGACKKHRFTAIHSNAELGGSTEKHGKMCCRHRMHCICNEAVFFSLCESTRRFKFTSDKDLKRKLSEFALHLEFLLLFANRIFFAFFWGGG